MPKGGEVGWGSTEYIVRRPKEPLSPEVAYCRARSEDVPEFAIRSMADTSGRQCVRAEALGHHELAAPPARVAEAFGRTVKPLFARAKKTANESCTLAALRDALLPKLIRGEIRVKDAERFLQERGV